MTNLLIKIFIKNSEDYTSPKVREKYGFLSSFVAIFCNIILFAAKYILGLVSHSIAITADAFNNLSDVGSAVATFIGFKVASQPADDDHPFGHGRIEYIAGLVITFLILTVGMEVIKSSFNKILNPEPISGNIYIVIALIASIGVKLWMGFFNKALADKIDSATMRAASQDSFNDSISTAVTTVCIILSFFIPFPIDGYLGICVGLFIIYSGYSMAIDTISPLLGQAPDPKIIKQIEQILLSYDIISGVHDLIIHDYGPGRTIASVHAEVPSDCNIMIAHDVIDNAEKRIEYELNIPCTIHFDPIEINCELTNELKAFTKKIIEDIDPNLSIHDFRMVSGDTHTNLIFDVVVPHRYKINNETLKKLIDEKIIETYPNYFTVITFEKSYI